VRVRLRGFRVTILALAAVAAIVAGITLTPSARSAITLPGNLAVFGQRSTIGALFTRSASGQLQNHFCTASVVDSPNGDLIVTAAHCMRGQKISQVAFVPGYSAGYAPYGIWNVTSVVEDPRWQTSADPDDDFAFLVVSQPGTKAPVETLTGGESLGVSAQAGMPVEVAGYPDTQDTPVSCENTVTAYSATQWEFDCDGFTNGTSGSPLLAKAVGIAGGTSQPGAVAMVIGVIGGYQQGGDTASVSYAARFSSQLAQLYQTAVVVSGRLGAPREKASTSGVTVAW
jgi:V8-like Glu-specific endopeptidase